MAAWIVYFIAGVAMAWSYSQDRWWQRALLVPFWLPIVAYGMANDIYTFWHNKGYHYEEDDDPLP